DMRQTLILVAERPSHSSITSRPFGQAIAAATTAPGSLSTVVLLAPSGEIRIKVPPSAKYKSPFAAQLKTKASLIWAKAGAGGLPANPRAGTTYRIRVVFCCTVASDFPSADSVSVR